MTAWIVYAALAVLWLGAPILGLWPPVTRDSDKGRTVNTMLGITMRPASFYERTNQVYAAVFAQELCEWWLKWGGAFIFGAIGVWLTDSLPTEPRYVALVASPIIAYLWALPMARQVELVGHACEVIVAGRTVDRDTYLAAEVARMRLGYGGMFATGDVEGAVRERFPVARLLTGILGAQIKRATS